MAGVIVELATAAHTIAASPATPASPVNTTGVVSDFYYHTDDLYNIMAITNPTGAVVERYEYSDYGQPRDPETLEPIDGNPSTIGNPYLFTGRRYDSETGWYYYRTRYLNPPAGRFTTRDTIGVWRDSINLGNGYAYVGNNPATVTDATGEGVMVVRAVVVVVGGYIVYKLISASIRNQCRVSEQAIADLWALYNSCDCWGQYYKSLVCKDILDAIQNHQNFLNDYDCSSR